MDQQVCGTGHHFNGLAWLRRCPLQRVSVMLDAVTSAWFPGRDIRCWFLCVRTWEGLGDDLVLHHDVGDLALDLHRLARQLGEDLLAEQDVLCRFQLHVPGLCSWEDAGVVDNSGQNQGNALLPVASIATSRMSGASTETLRYENLHSSGLVMAK